MKSKHRHELKENELLEWLQHFPEWFGGHYRVVLYVVLVVAVVAGVAFSQWYKINVTGPAEQIEFSSMVNNIYGKKLQVLRALQEGQDYSYVLIQQAESIGRFVGKSESNRSALALINRADILRAELHYRLSRVSVSDISEQIGRAKNNYSRALDVLSACEGQAELVGKARLGLGLCEEELGNFDKAMVIYQEISSDKGLQDTMSAVEAGRRAEFMTENTEKVEFAAAEASEGAVGGSGDFETGVQPGGGEMPLEMPNIVIPELPGRGG